ncbi:hypothetical protein IW140_000930 [Coemansia sp. RSA 1813]|nr:hypothetical protein EV178_001349 [Coemansia sp. RSA 1646]KAJ1772899.1 hypothetical protein LPJ74_001037 [Coemansia sp. RSA 1843]KAJ2093471.1 hypothetical protein IW138_000321 [Coemansia sp. RSA 986]KAJ2217280.1 hypothetical protein EV179_000747 [Coemansia sp. RSA 487]KAJ2572479.1 hypothetical protein IW140_000930 [Coemansia sp. RSA 1813]
MGSFRTALTDADKAWIGKQKVYFVATAPLEKDDHVNLSPKGYSSMHIVGDNRVILLDGRGSGCETISHLRENKRITVMLCAFDGPPRIMRLFGNGTVHEPGSTQFEELFQEHYAEDWNDPNKFKFVRSIIDIQVHLVGQSCGYAVPFMEYKSDRKTLVEHLGKKTKEKLDTSRINDNTFSIDGIPSFLDGTSPGGVAAKRKANSIVEVLLPWVGGAALGASVAAAVLKSASK